MDGNKAGAPKSRMFVFRYMTFDEIAQALRTTPALAQTLVSRKGWRLHEDMMGRPRASVPEAYLNAWAAISTSLDARPAHAADLGAARQDHQVRCA